MLLGPLAKKKKLWRSTLLRKTRDFGHFRTRSLNGFELGGEHRTAFYIYAALGSRINASLRPKFLSTKI